MSDLFLALFLFSFLGLFLGLINPKIVIYWGKKRNRGQVLLFYGLAMLVFFVLFGIFTSSNPKTVTTEKNNNEKTVIVKKKAGEKNTEQSTKTKVNTPISNDKNENKADNKIPGLFPSDVYLNMENEGFKTTKNLGGELGNLWKCTQNSAGIDYSVDIFSSSGITVETMTATAMIQDVVNKDIVATKQFLKYVGSIPYDGSDPTKVASWIDENFNNDKSSITISKVKFTIYAPTKFVRMLGIEKE